MAPRLPIVDEGAAGAEERTKLGVEIFVQQFEADWSEVLPSESLRLLGDMTQAGVTYNFFTL